MAISGPAPSTQKTSGNRWRSWKSPGERPRPYSVYVDERDHVWLTDLGAAIVRFEPRVGALQGVHQRSAGANVRQMLGRRGEVRGAESGTDRLVVVREPSVR